MRSYSRLGKLGQDDDKVSEYQHWNTLGDTERFRVAWDLVVQAFLMKGKSLAELRFQRSVTRLERR